MYRFFLLLFVSIGYLQGQTYLHGTTGVRNERVTHCLVSTCGGTYLDNGGSLGNYSNSIAGGVYRVFCPNIVGNCVRARFTQFNTEATFDFLTIGNGATQNSPVFTTSPATVPFGRISGNPAIPFSFTANNPSGCLTFRFNSDNSVTAAGWSATLSCVPCATLGNGPNATDNNDCVRATPICFSITNNVNSRGPGLISEGCIPNACPAGGENHSNWYTFTVLTSGTLSILIDPQTNTDDYDFAIFGPNATCGSLGAPIRCSDSGNAGNTGTNASSLDLIEDVLGDGFLAQMNVVAGQTYILVVDEWLSNTGNGYTLNFGGTAVLDCGLLPIELIYFGAEYKKESRAALLTWGAGTESLAEYFVVEKSNDGYTFDSIGVVASFGVGRNDYEFLDAQPMYHGFTYYRLKMYDGQIYHYSDISAIAVEDNGSGGVVVYPNPVEDDMLNITNFGSYLGECTTEILNSSGQVVREEKFQVGVLRSMGIDIQDLPSGVYTVVVYTNDSKIFKIIKR
jgi:hypothetical protein